MTEIAVSEDIKKAESRVIDSLERYKSNHDFSVEYSLTEHIREFSRINSIVAQTYWSQYLEIRGKHIIENMPKQDKEFKDLEDKLERLAGVFEGIHSINPGVIRDYKDHIIEMEKSFVARLQEELQDKVKEGINNRLGNLEHDISDYLRHRLHSLSEIHDPTDFLNATNDTLREVEYFFAKYRKY